MISSRDPAGGPGAWTATALGHGSLSSVSCPTVSLCVAVGPAGVAVSTDPTGGPTSWTVTPGSFGASLSCPSTRLCVAVDVAGDLITSRDPPGGAGAWTATSLGNGYCYHGACSADTFTGVSCSSESLCVGVDYAGNATVSTDPTGGPSAWRSTYVDGRVGALARVSCATDLFCAAVDYGGNVVTSTAPTGGASAWTVAAVDGLNVLSAVSCPSRSLCVAVDSTGHVVSSARPEAAPARGTSPESTAAGAWSAFRVRLCRPALLPIATETWSPRDTPRVAVLDGRSSTAATGPE